MAKRIYYCDMDGVLANFGAEPNAVERFAVEKGFFANLPIIGDLFAPNHAVTSNETELVITLTPYIIRPSNEQMYYPVDGINNSNTIQKRNNARFDKGKGVTKDYVNDYVKPLEARWKKNVIF